MPIERIGGTSAGIRRSASGSRIAVLRPQAGKGEDGSNVLPTDTAMANGVNNVGGVYPLFSAALTASYGGAGISPSAFGGVASTSVNNTTAVHAAFAAAAAADLPVFIPGGTWLTDPVTVSGVDNFRLDMVGTLKRRNSSATEPLLFLDSLTSPRIGTINTDGNVANNGVTVTEGKMDVKIADCTDVQIGTINSNNPAGDACYIGSSGHPSVGVRIGHLNAKADTNTGRNALSIICGSDIQVGTLRSVNVGHTSMPGGLDIEPNLITDLVTNVSVGEAFIQTAGSGGFAANSIFGKIITGFIFGRVILKRLTGAPSGSAGFTLNGVSGATGDITVIGEGVGSCASLNDADNLDVRMSLSNSGGNSLTIGAGATVSKSRIRGAVRTAVTHLVQCYALTDSVVDLDLKDAGAAGTYFALPATAVMSNVTLRGDWSKGSTGLRAFGGAGSSGNLTNVILDAVNFLAWSAGARRTGGSDVNAVLSRDCPGLNTGSAAPGVDQWEVGAFVRNTSPTNGGVAGWTCVVAGAPATGSFRAVGIIANFETVTTTQLTDQTAAINTTGKFQGKVVRNSTTNRHLQAGGAGATSTWQDFQGTTVHTPV